MSRDDVEHQVTLIYVDPDDNSRWYSCSCGEEFLSVSLTDRVCPESFREREKLNPLDY